MSCCNNNNPDRYAGSGGGGMTMKKKYAHKFSKNSSGNGNYNANGSFSLNGVNNNNINGYIGNPNSAINSAISLDRCKTYDTNVKTSVKNYRGYMQNKLRCSPVYSFNCYKTVNHALVEIDGNLNKHLTANNNDQSSYVSLLKTKCSQDRSNYAQEISGNTCCDSNDSANNRNMTSTSRTLFLMRKNNVTKDNNTVRGITPGYGIYYNDSTLFKKKDSTCLHNPPDAKNGSC
jgi:hypothetical protein